VNHQRSLLHDPVRSGARHRHNGPGAPGSVCEPGSAVDPPPSNSSCKKLHTLLDNQLLLSYSICDGMGRVLFSRLLATRHLLVPASTRFHGSN
jgi:hypothetical protein